MRNREKRYKQIVHLIEEKITSGEYHVGDKIPSVNAYKIRFGLSRSSIFQAMNELKSRGLIESEPSIGYFVASSEVKVQEKVFLLFNEFTSFKEDLYNAFEEEVGDGVSTDIFFHNYNQTIFKALLCKADGKYTTYVVMPGKFSGLEGVLQDISGHMILLDHCHPELKGKFPFVGQNFAKDTYQALCSGLERIRKYKSVVFIQRDSFEPDERYIGIGHFCKNNGFNLSKIETIGNLQLQKGVLYITASDRELVEILKKAMSQNLALGKTIGVISYNDTPIKEVLCGGITTISTDFKQMGKTLARLVRDKNMETIYNPCSLIIRGSI